MPYEAYDNTRVSAHRGCNRRYFFRHKAHIKSVGPELPLVFGLSWHSAMDVVWEHAKSSANDDELANLAYHAFRDTWEEEGLTADPSPDQADTWLPRVPGVGLEMIYYYIKQWRAMIATDYELLQIEMPFAVPLDPDDPNLLYIGRIDKVVRWRGKVWGIEHKTTSSYKKDGYFRTDFLESFSPNSQIDGYLHALRMVYGDDAKGIIVDAALVHRTVHEGFKHIPIDKAEDLLSAWLYDTIEEIKRIRINDEQLLLVDEEDRIMAAYPKNTGDCSSFFGRPCPYINICKGDANPLDIYLGEIPHGFEFKKWEPWDVLHIDKLGLSK